MAETDCERIQEQVRIARKKETHDEGELARRKATLEELKHQPHPDKSQISKAQQAVDEARELVADDAAEVQTFLDDYFECKEHGGPGHGH
ncbi:hypothetical protein [Streptomyces lydicus]|uniref:hypothetical protein n=1 Tax=Streptomyces lydicus TaxID=47763 RepID=UPI003334482E